MTTSTSATAPADRHAEIVEQHRRETAETGRRRYLCTSRGFNRAGVWVVGPVVVDVVIWQRTDPTGERQYRPSFSVEIDGRHQYGGPADHLVDGIPAGGMLLGWTPDPELEAEAERPRIVVDRTQVYPRPARRGPAWHYVYDCTGPDGTRFDNRSLVELRRVLRSRYGRDVEIVEQWKAEA